MQFPIMASGHYNANVHVQGGSIVSSQHEGTQREEDKMESG